MLVRDLGLKDFEEVWTLQRKLVFERAAEMIPDTVLLCQHHPVYTIGRSSKQAVPEGLPHPVFKIERGGDLTWHGPGQLVGYPIFDLPALELKARSYLSALESVLREAVKLFGVTATTVKGFTGLWVGKKKLASIGVAVRHGVTYHGFALNMNNSLSPFQCIHPCRLESEVMTSMAKILGRPVDETAVSTAVGKTLIEYFGHRVPAALVFTMLILAAPARAAFEVPGFELAYSFPAETNLDEPDVRRAQDMWPEMFDAAKKSIDVEQFYITPASGEPLEASLQALERAASRGVRIRFLLEKKFEKNSLDGIARLKSIPNLDVRIIDWSKLQGEGVVHAKFFIIDGVQAFVGSQNFDWRSLKHIHELGLRVTEADINARFAAVFEHDWAAAALTAKGEGAPAVRLKRPQADRSRRAYLVASPWPFNPSGVGDSEAELVHLIGEARSEVCVQLLDYTPTSYGSPKRYYAPIDAALRDAAVRGVKVKLMVSHWNTAEPAVSHLKSLALLPGVKIKIVTIPQAKQGYIPFSRVIHSKYMVVDDKTLWLGTSNWGGGYLDQSRNVELVVKDDALAARVARVHAHLWTSSYAAALDIAKAYPKPKK